MTVWCAGLDEYHIWYMSLCIDDRLVCRFGWIRHLVYVTLYRWPFDVQVWMSLIQTCTSNGHLYRATYTRKVQMKTLNIFYLIIYWIQKVHNDFSFLRSLKCVQYKCSSVSEVHGCLYKKILLAESAATRAPPAGPLHQTWKTCLPSPVWAVQTRENHCRRSHVVALRHVEDP